MIGIKGLDLILLAIMFLSGFLAMLRGLTREVLSIMSWALAAMAALFVFSLYQEQVRNLIGSKTVADVVLIGATFVTVLVIVSLVTARLSDRVLDSRVGAIDRTLGFIFGLARGLLLVVIAYELYVHIVPKEKLPEWVTQAQSYRTVEDTGEFILKRLLIDNPLSFLQKKEHPGAQPE